MSARVLRPRSGALASAANGGGHQSAATGRFPVAPWTEILLRCSSILDHAAALQALLPIAGPQCARIKHAVLILQETVNKR